MARKTDYTSDQIGNWVVVSRAAPVEGKRFWNVTNLVTKEDRVVAQTALAGLADETKQGKLLAAALAPSSWGDALPFADVDDYQVPDDYHLGECPALPESNVVTKFGGVGEAAEESVTEAELDERVPPVDPVRTLIRKAMGDVANLRAAIAALSVQADNLNDLVDETLKASIVR